MNNCKPRSGKKILAFIYMLLLSGSSFIPMDRQIRGLEFIIELNPTIQNILHVPVYFLLAVFLLQIFPRSKFGRWKSYCLVLFVAGLLGVFNEIVQIAVPGRYADLTDIFLNLGGATAGIVFFSLAENSKSGFMRRIVCE